MTRTALACTLALIAAITLVRAQTPPAGALEHIWGSGRIRFGYLTDARPFSYRDPSGTAGGYSVALCHEIATAAKAELRTPILTVDWIPVAMEHRYQALRDRTIDILCGAETITLERRSAGAFSLPIFPGGIGVLVRADAPIRLRDVLSGRGQTFQPTWRASASEVLRARAFAAVANTTSERWLRSRIEDLQVLSSVAPVASYEAGIDAVLARRADALFAERAILLDASRRHTAARDLLVLDRLFTYEPLALALPPGDERFRLFVDRTLSHFYASGQLAALYTTWFGEPDQTALTFFRWSTLPD